MCVLGSILYVLVGCARLVLMGVDEVILPLFHLLVVLFVDVLVNFVTCVVL